MIADAENVPRGRHPLVSFIARWVLTTNHKEIGTLYLCLSFTLFLIGGSMAMIFRLELAQPGLQFLAADFYNQMVTLHGLIMVFGAVMPAFVGTWLITAFLLIMVMPAAEKKLVPKWRSVSIIVTVPASTGMTMISRNAVISQLQTNKGIFINVMPGARRLNIVTMILIAPNTDEIPIRWMPKIRKSVLGGP